MNGIEKPEIDEATRKSLLLQLDKLVEQGLTVGDIINHYGKSDEDSPIVAIARAEYVSSDGDIDMDDRCLLAPGENGSYVSAWVWVANFDLKEGEEE